MKNPILGLAIALVPILMASPLFISSGYAVAAASPLGDLSSMQAIVVDTLALANAGDFASAEKRITDYETAWDAQESTLRPLDSETWTALDHASDAAIEVLRSASPSTDKVVPPLETLAAALGNPPSAAGGAIASGGTFTLTNSDGSPLPCETALAELRRVSASKAPTAADQATFDELQTKGIERCNADDDTRADKLFGEALALLNR